MRYTHSQLAYWQIISNNNEYTELLCSFISVYTTINGYYENRFTLFAMLLISTGILAQSPVKVDFDKDERALDEVHEPGYESWVITNCVDTTKVING